jgi:hypothetical protein
VFFEMIGLEMTTQWIGPDENLKLNDVGFLIRFDNSNTGAERWELRDTPACKNISHEPVLNGWCGSYNNISTNATGMSKVVRVARNGRCLVQSIDGQELKAALEELGYPDL